MTKGLKIAGILLLGFVPASDTIPRQLPKTIRCNAPVWARTGRSLVECGQPATTINNGRSVCHSHRTSLIGASS